MNLNKSVFKITYISTWKHEILSLATWEITNFELEFLKYNWFILCFLLLSVVFLKHLTDTNQIEKMSQSSYFFHKMLSKSISKFPISFFLLVLTSFFNSAKKCQTNLDQRKEIKKCLAASFDKFCLTICRSVHKHWQVVSCVEEF